VRVVGIEDGDQDRNGVGAGGSFCTPGRLPFRAHCICLYYLFIYTPGLTGVSVAGLTGVSAGGLTDVPAAGLTGVSAAGLTGVPAAGPTGSRPAVAHSTVYTL